MKRTFTKLMAALALLTFLAVPMGMWGQTATLVSGSGTSGYSIPEGWTTSGTVEGGSYLKLDNGTITSPEFAPHNGLSFTYTVATFGSGTNHPLTIRILNASTNAVIVEKTTATPTSATYISTDSPLSLGDVTVAFKIQMYAPSGKGIRLRNYSVTGTPAGDIPTTYTLTSAVTPTGTGTVELSKTSLEQGETATATATANAHYTFTSWSIAGESATLTSTTTNPTTVTMGTANATITATFTEDPKYDITYNPNYEGSTDEPVVVSDYAGETMTIADYSTFSRTGYAITSWNTQADGNGTSYSAGDSYTMTSAGLTLYAQWEEKHEQTVTLTQSVLGLTGSYTTNTQKTIDGITYVYTDLMKSNDNIQAKANTGTIKNSTAYSGDIISVVITHSGTARATTINGSANGTDWTQVATGSGSINADFTGKGYKYFQITRGDNAAYWTKVEITWSTAPSTDPSITAEDVDITYDAVEGNIAYQIVNPVEGAIIQPVLADDAAITNFVLGEPANGAVHFTCDANATNAIKTATVTLNYVSGDATLTTKDVTITQAADPNYVMTITEARAQTTGSTVITKGIVTSKVDNTAYIQDANAAICVYGNSDYPLTSINVGNEIKVSGTLTNYNNLLEITNPTCTVLSTDNPVTPTVMTIAEILESTNQGWFIKIEGATVGGTTSGNTTLTQDESSIVARNLSGATQGDVINLTGNIGRYNSNNQIANPSVIYDPSVSIDPATADPFTYVYSHGPSEEQLFTVTGAHLTSSDITVTVTAGSEYFEITDDETYGSTVTIASGSIISVRLKAGLETSANYEGTLTIASQGAQDVTVALTGTVTNQTYTISDLTGDWGEITFSPSATVEAGAQVTLTVVPGDAYYFIGTLRFYNGTELIQKVTNASNPYVYTMPAHNVNVAAELQTKTQYNIATVVNPTASGTVVTDDTAWEGKVVEIAVEAAVGYALSSLTATYVDSNDETQELTITNNTFVMPAFAVTVTANFEQLTDVTYDFTKIDGFSDWGTSYEEHEVEYPTATVTFASANRSTQTITNQPVTKGDPVIIVMKNGLTLTSAAFECTQWGNKAQTITLHYSTNGGETFTPMSVTSTNFNISSNLPVGTNALKITFSSSSNQVGIASATVNIQTSTVNKYTLTLGNDDHINDYYMFVNNDNNPVEFDENDEMEVYEGSVVYVSVAEVEDCYLFNGLSVTYGDSQVADTTKYDDMYYSFVMPAADATLNFVTSEATKYTLTVESSHVTLDLIVGEDSEVQSGDDVCEGLHVTIVATAESGYVLQPVNVVDEDQQIVDVTKEGDGVYWFVMPTKAVTINAVAVERTLTTYTLATTIAPGTYLITNGSSKAMGKQNTNNRAAADVDINAGVAAVNSDDEDVYEFIIGIVSSGSETLYTIQDAKSSKYLCATSGNSNYLKEEDALTDYSKWAINIENGVASIVANSGSRNVMRFNSNSNLFSCYGQNNTQQDIYLYEKNENIPPQTIEDETIVPYEGDGGYALIASPVIGVIPTANNGFLTNEYDFYYFDQSQEGEEWRNFKASSFNLISGKGYLYANNGVNGTPTLTFSGTPYNGTGVIDLNYTDGNQFAGWNLIGNPYANPAILRNEDNTTDVAYYEMNQDGSEIVVGTAGNAIPAMRGVFVIADNNEDKVTFVEQQPSPNPDNAIAVSQLSINVSKSRGGSIDRAIVRFDNGNQLPKFQLNPKHTKVYFTNDNKDYAVVRSASEGEMPVSFKAENNGTYTFSVNIENVEMNYLHLIDNMTGADIDLLATPSYSFEAKTSDYASRFRLVFSANEGSNENGNETFAYYNGSEWVINNPSTGSGDNATLQVIDMMGRVLSSETISGNATINLNQMPGVYMFRLVNGENVMVQKVVVR